MGIGTEQVVVFRLGSEFFGIGIESVNEIIRIREITAIPKSEVHLRGLINLRGKTIPVVDLNTRLGLGDTEETTSTRIIVVETDDGNVGMIVDGVSEVVTLQENEVEKTPPLVDSVASEYVRAVAKQSNRLVTLLSVEKALAA